MGHPSVVLRNGDYVPDGRGGLRRAEGQEAPAGAGAVPADGPPGDLPFLPELGSRLWQLGQLSPPPAAERGGAVCCGGPGGGNRGLSVEQVRFEELAGGGRAQVTAELIFRG